MGSWVGGSVRLVNISSPRSIVNGHYYGLEESSRCEWYLRGAAVSQDRVGCNRNMALGVE
jgi:hypothetical protein